MDTQEFFNLLFTTSPRHHLSLFTLPDKRSFHVDPSDFHQAGLLCEKLNQQGKDVYFGLGLRSKDFGAQRGTSKDIAAIPGVWSEIDYGTEGHASKNLPPDQKTALALLEESPIKPTLVVDTGGGLHVYVLFTNPESTPGAQKLVTAYNEHLRKIVEGAGYEFDTSTKDLARVFRVPNTNNRKLPSKLRYVSVIRYNGQARYTVEELEKVLHVRRVTSKPELIITQAAPISPTQAAPSAIEVIERLKQIKSGHQLLAQAIVNGTPFSVPGNRDVDLNRMAYLVADMDPDTDPSELAEIFRPTIRATVRRDGNWDEDDIVEKVEMKLRRHQATAREKRDHATATQNVLVRPAQPKTITVPEKELIIQRGDSYYIHAYGEYQPPKSKNELKLAIENYWADYPQRLYSENEEGKVVKKTIGQLLSEYGQVADEVFADLTIPESRFDSKTRVFCEAAGRLRDLQPEFSEEVDTWLYTFAKKQIDKLLDWMAVITQLEKSNTALCLLGAPGSGKSLFAYGVSRLYSASGPTEMRRVIGNFNGDLVRCPIIVADEEIPTSGMRNSTQLRDMITAQTRTLSRKFMHNADLRGATRIVILANDLNVLNFADEDLSTNDLNAYADRFLIVDVPKDATEYLRSLGNVNHWIEKDIIAKHALWLKENRKVVPGRRFLVEPMDTINVRHKIATRGKWTGLACQWIARHLDAPQQIVANAKRKAVIVGDGNLLVNSDLLVKYWDSYIENGGFNRPSVSLLGRSLNHLHTHVKQVEGLKYHAINVELLLWWIEENQIGNLDAIKETIRAGIKVFPHRFGVINGGPENPLDKK